MGIVKEFVNYHVVPARGETSANTYIFITKNQEISENTYNFRKYYKIPGKTIPKHEILGNTLLRT
jgi:hypothetical protein